MSETILRVDLRDDAQGRARDFRKVALQPGVPLLDPSNTNYRTLRKWFGICIAQPEFRSDRPDSVGFCVCDEQERRIVNVHCKPLTENDLKNRSDIARQFEELKAKIQTIQPGNPAEATLLAAIRSHFVNVTSNPGNLGFSFFQYKNGSGQQLVWLWGYERRDTESASVTLCKRDGCSHLIARRAGEKAVCPVCQGATKPFSRQTGSRAFSRALMILLFLLLLLGGALFALRSQIKDFRAPEMPTDAKDQVDYAVRTVPELAAPWRIPVGGRLTYQIVRIDAGREEDVTDRVDVTVDNPQTARIDRVSRSLRAWSVGETTVSFYSDQREIRTLPLTVLPPTMPTTLRLDPDELTLGVGSTRQLTLLGQYDDQRIIDLTEVALWKPVDGSAVSNVLGRLEGREEGKSEVVASYSPGENVPAMNAACRIDVLPENYTAIELRGVPSRLYEGFASSIEIVTKNEKGEERILTRSPRLRFLVEPPEAAIMENGDFLVALTSGKAKIKALYDKMTDETLEASMDFEIVRDETASHFLVRPDEMKLVVGESLLLDILPRGPDAVEALAGDESVVELLDGNHVVGRKPGKTSIFVSQNNVRKEIPVEVSEIDWESIAFSPDRIFVAVDRYAPLRLVGKDRSGKERDIGLDQIVWETEADPDFVRLDPHSFGVVGLKPTGARPVSAKVRYGKQTAEVRIEVLSAPLRLEMTPAGPFDLPVDQQVQFTVRADYGDGPMEIAPDRIRWNVRTGLSGPDLPEGVVWEPEQGVLKAEKVGVGPVEISAFYQGETTKSCQVKTGESAPVEIVLAADKPSLDVKEQGHVLVTLKNPASLTCPIPEKYSFQSKSDVLTVDPETGRYTATASGKGGVIARHPAVKGDASVSIEVTDANNKPRLEIRPNKITLYVGETASLALVKIDGDQETLIPFARRGKSLLTTANTSAVQIRLPDRILGVKPAPPFQIFAEYQGMDATAIVEVKTRQPGNPPKSRRPSSPKKKTTPSTSGWRSGDSGRPGRGGYPAYGTAAGVDGGYGGSGRPGRGGSGGRSGKTDSNGPDAPLESRLILCGPDRMTVDSEVELTATLDDRDVTFDLTSLVLDRESAELAEPMAGCMLRAQKPGTLNVRARRFDLVSDPIQIEIEPRAEKFDRLELEIDRNPMVIGERRPYKLWGYPLGGGLRQDLTLIALTGPGEGDDDCPRVELVDVAGSDEAEQIVSNAPPYLSAKSTGRFRLTASYQQDRPVAVPLEVVGRTGDKTLHVQPSSITIPAGESTPPITVSVESPLRPDRTIHVEARLESADEKILAPIPGKSDRFRAGEVGRTSITVKAVGQETSIPVQVLDQPFHHIALDRNADLLADGRFRVYVDVEAITENRDLEYRIVPLDEKNKQAWVPLETGRDGRQRVRLTGPELQGGAVDERHHLIIETRDKKTDRHERHPLDFRIKGKTIEVEP